ncbi:hypothetical protein ACSBR2_012471 [Camellia fascicularis]
MDSEGGDLNSPTFHGMDSEGADSNSPTFRGAGVGLPDIQIDPLAFVAEIDGGLLGPIGPLGFGIYADLLGPPIDGIKSLLHQTRQGNRQFLSNPNPSLQITSDRGSAIGLKSETIEQRCLLNLPKLTNH